MDARKRSFGGVDGIQEVKVANESGVGGIHHHHHFPTQQPMVPPHYFPPHQYPPGQYHGYPMYPMMPYPQMYGYHHYPPHLDANMMRQPYAMTPNTFAKHNTSAPPAIPPTQHAPNKAETIGQNVSVSSDKNSDEMISQSIKPTVSAETSASGSPSDTQPVVITKKTEMVSDSQVLLQGSTSDESEIDVSLFKQPPSKPTGDNAVANENASVMTEKQHVTTANENEDTPPLSLAPQMKQEHLPMSSLFSKEEAVSSPHKETNTQPHEDNSTNNCVIVEKQNSEVTLGDTDPLAPHFADTNRSIREGVESLLLLSRVAEKIKSSEDEAEKSSCRKQQSGQDKPLKKRKLQLPMRTDRKEEGPLPKRKPASPQRTPAFFRFLLHHKESIEQTIFSDEDMCYGLERSEKVAKEGAMWWMASSEEEKQRWADVSTLEYREVSGNSF